MEEKFFLCETCGNLMIAAIASGVVPYCCGDEMTQLKVNTVDGSKEKHLPVVAYVSKHCMKVSIGAEPHPMTPKHNIRFVCLETTTGFIVRYLDEADRPEVHVCFTGKPIAVYAYCNIHGLWRADVQPYTANCGNDE